MIGKSECPEQETEKAPPCTVTCQRLSRPIRAQDVYDLTVKNSDTDVKLASSLCLNNHRIEKKKKSTNKEEAVRVQRTFDASRPFGEMI